MPSVFGLVCSCLSSLLKAQASAFRQNEFRRLVRRTNMGGLRRGAHLLANGNDGQRSGAKRKASGLTPDERARLDSGRFGPGVKAPMPGVPAVAVLVDEIHGTTHWFSASVAALPLARRGRSKHRACRWCSSWSDARRRPGLNARPLDAAPNFTMARSSSSTRTAPDRAFGFGSRQSSGGENRRRGFAKRIQSSLGAFCLFSSLPMCEHRVPMKPPAGVGALRVSELCS